MKLASSGLRLMPPAGLKHSTYSQLFAGSTFPATIVDVWGGHRAARARPGEAPAQCELGRNRPTLPKSIAWPLISGRRGLCIERKP
jgi:hypothetical protein